MFEIIFNPFLKYPISDDIFSIVHEIGTRESYDSPKMIINPYELVDNVYFIESGKVSYLSVDLNGKQYVLGILESGTCFGTPSLILGITSKEVCAETNTPAVLYKIPKDKYLNQINSSEIFRDYVLKGLASDCYQLVSCVSNLTMNSSKKRLYELFILLIKEESNSDNWYNLNSNYTQEQLAKIIGISKSAIQYTLYSMRDEGLIKFVNNKIKVMIQKDEYGNIIEPSL